MMEEAKKNKSLRLLTVLLSVAAVAAMLWCADRLPQPDPS